MLGGNHAFIRQNVAKENDIMVKAVEVAGRRASLGGEEMMRRDVKLSC